MNMKNIDDEKDRNDDLELPDRKDSSIDAIQKLEKELESVKERLREVLYILAIVVFIAFNTATFALIENWAGALGILILELLILLPIARQLNIQDLQDVVNKYFYHRRDRRKRDQND